MSKQGSSVLPDLHKNPVPKGEKFSSQGRFTMSCRAFCCCVFFTGAILSFILSTILLFGVQNYHKADPVKIYEVFQTPKYALTNELLDNTKYLILYGQASTGILNFIEHEANLRVIEGKPVVIRQLDENIIKKHMKETKHFVEMYLGQVGRGHHSWFILLNDTETPTHQISSLQKKYPHDTIVLLTPKKLEIEGFTSHKFPALKAKQLKQFMEKDLDMDKKQIKQIFDQSASKDIPDLLYSYKNHEQEKVKAAEQAEKLRLQQQEEQRRLKQEAQKRKQIEAQRAGQQENSQDQQTEQKQTKGKKNKKSKGKAPKSKKQSKPEKKQELINEEVEEEKQIQKPKKSEKKSKSQSKHDKKSTKKTQDKQQVQAGVKTEQPQVEGQTQQQAPVVIDIQQAKVSLEPKKGKGKKNKKVKESVQNVPETTEQVQVPVIEQVKVETLEDVEPVISEQVKQQAKQGEETKKTKEKESKNQKKQSKKGKKGSKKSKQVPQVPEQKTEIIVTQQQKVVQAEKSEEIPPITEVIEEETTAQVEVQQIPQTTQPVTEQSDL